MSDMADDPGISVMAAPRLQRGWRLFIFYSSAVLLTGLVSMLFADLLWRTGWTAARARCCWCCSSFCSSSSPLVHARRLWIFSANGSAPGAASRALKNYRDQKIDGTSTAIVFPIYNENVVRVFEGLRATYESLERTGQLERFDFFILSDSTDPDKWVEEERRWWELVRELDALGKIYYRRRMNNEGRKSGNVSDFLNAWGRRYRYFMVCDADSVMRGETLVDLVKLMEAHPAAGLIQTVPALVNAESLFGRIQQFANRLYAPVFIAGMNYWSLGCRQLLGTQRHHPHRTVHAILRLAATAGTQTVWRPDFEPRFCRGRSVVKENWEVWVAYDLEGSYEEAPQTIIENAQRDRRWCQGNLQHGMVLFAKGLRGISRMHLMLGIFGYLASPLWLAFLLVFNWIYWFQHYTGLSQLPLLPAFTPYLRLSGTAHALLIFVICMAFILLPKFLALLDLAYDWPRRRAFGGLARATAGVVLETVFSTLHAPLQMLWHTRFVVSNLLGVSVGWSPPKRIEAGTPWLFALRRHWGHTLIGLIWGAFMWQLDPTLFWWFTPVLAGMALSIPSSVITSRRHLGARLRKLGLFLTPEETAPPPELVALRARMKVHEITGSHAFASGPASTRAGPHHAHTGLAEAVLDPYVNAIHVSLLREKRLNPTYAEQLFQLGAGSETVGALGEKLLANGPEKLTPAERMAVMADQRVMVWLHQQAWMRPDEKLAPWWRAMIREFGQRET